MSMSAEMLSQPPPSSVADVEPGRIKVFGIIHIIFGGLGLVGSVFGVAALLVLNPVLSWLEETIRQEIPSGDMAGPEVEATLESFGAMRTLMSDLSLLYWVSAVTGLVVAILILWAGIRLIRKRKDAVRCSNIYTWASIVKWLLYLGLYLVTGPAAMKSYYGKLESIVGGSGLPAPGGMNLMQFQEVIGVATTVIGGVLALIYPILSFAMLNKMRVKDFLARNGT